VDLQYTIVSCLVQHWLLRISMAMVYMQGTSAAPTVHRARRRNKRTGHEIEASSFWSRNLASLLAAGQVRHSPGGEVLNIYAWVHCMFQGIEKMISSSYSAVVHLLHIIENILFANPLVILERYRKCISPRNWLMAIVSVPMLLVAEFGLELTLRLYEKRKNTT
jgi:hypothetical protein